MRLEGASVVVIGGAGFIGSHVTQQLVEQGASVHVIDNLHRGKQAFVPDEVELDTVAVQNTDIKEIMRAYDPDAIIHLAALHYIPYCNEHPEETFDVNVMGTRNVVSAAADIGVESFVFTSSAAVYEPSKQAHTVNDNLNPIDIYGKTKVIGEQLVELFHQRTDIGTVSLRLFNTYGIRETNPHLIPEILSQIQQGKREIKLGNLTPARDFVHVKDVSKAIVGALDTSEGYDTYNVGSGQSHSVQDVVEKIAGVCGVDIRIVQEEERIRSNDRPNLEGDISKTQKELGWEPKITFTDGLTQLFEDEFA